MDGGFSSKRKILLISHSVGAEAMGDRSVPAAAADKGQALLREKKAGANAHDEHSRLKAAKAALSRRFILPSSENAAQGAAF